MSTPPQTSTPCETIELNFTAAVPLDNPYVEQELDVAFTGPGGACIRRPAFWMGGNGFGVRFAPTAPGPWRWQSTAQPPTRGLHDQNGEVQAIAYGGVDLRSKGLLRMSPGGRNVIHATGAPFFMVADTPWALPWRATLEDATVYAQDRKAAGFNAALLMSVQPDRFAVGPLDRSAFGGFDVGFSDLPQGHLNQLVPAYFDKLDALIDVLINHDIVPVLQPVFQGFGWKGLTVLGTHAVPAEYARYCKYLVARYGHQPAMWLISADGTAHYDCIKAAGAAVQKWDAYEQPTGIHYSPFEYLHGNRAHQNAAWLDFQWCQTGHRSVHDTGPVKRMQARVPIKAVANGEPTYEGILNPQNGAGVWQMHEAWSQVCAGGTMGVVYGAGGLWQWKLSDGEPGWPAWADGPSWKRALTLPGRTFVGYLAKALAGFDFIDVAYAPHLAGGRDCVARAAESYLVFMPDGGEAKLQEVTRPLRIRWFDPEGGVFGPERVESASLDGNVLLMAPSRKPWVLLAELAQHENRGSR